MPTRTTSMTIMVIELRSRGSEGKFTAASHRSKPPTVHLRIPQHVIVRPGQGLTAPERFAVLGWTDEWTRRWLDNASAGWSQA